MPQSTRRADRLAATLAGDQGKLVGWRSDLAEHCARGVGLVLNTRGDTFLTQALAARKNPDGQSAPIKPAAFRVNWSEQSVASERGFDKLGRGCRARE